MSGIISDNLGRATGLIKATSGGKILQMVHASDATQRTHSADTWTKASNTLDCTITPSATSSKVILMSSVSMKSGGDFGCTFFRDTTNLGDSDDGFGRVKEWILFGSTVVDEPSSTSEIVYSFQMKATDEMLTYMNYSGAVGRVLAMEIGA